MYPHHVFDLEPVGTFGMYPICYQRISGRYFQPEPAMYARCFHWFPGPLSPSVHYQWCAAVLSSPSLQIPWKVSWVIYKILLSISLSRKEEGNYLMCRWVMSPPRQWGMNPVIETRNILKEPTCGQRNWQPRDLLAKGSWLDDGMLKQRHRWNSGCLRWVKASWWDLSAVFGFLLSSLRSTNHISHHYQSLTQPTHL